MPSDSSTPPDSDDLDLDWDDEPSSPPAAAQASSSAPPAPVAPRLGAKESARPMPPRSVPPPKLTAKRPVRSATPRSVPPVRLPPTKKASLAPPPPQSRPATLSQPPPPSKQRQSLRPVSVAPRPGSSSPNSERPGALAAGSQVALPAVPPPPQARQELPTPSPVADAPATDVALAASAPAAIMTSNALEALPAPASLPADWLDAADTLRPNELDAPSASSIAVLRGQRRWQAQIAVGVAACVGLIWLVASSASSAPDTMAELPQARPLEAPSPAPAAPAPVTATPSSEATATLVANNNALGFADSFKAALADTPATTPATTPVSTIAVTVRISPSDATVFKSGRRLGRGNVTVNVPSGTKITLSAERDGYSPRTLVLDGSYNSVNIALKRAQARR